ACQAEADAARQIRWAAMREFTGRRTTGAAGDRKPRGRASAPRRQNGQTASAWAQPKGDIMKQEASAPAVTIYHNPACGTSRNTLALIRGSGIEPQIVEYLKHPPGRERLLELIAALGLPVREVLRRKGTPYDELG